MPVGGVGAKVATPVGKAVGKVVCLIFCKEASRTVSVKIVERDGVAVVLIGKTSNGVVEVYANMVKKGKSLRLTGVHIDGPGPGSIGRADLLALAKELGRIEGVRSVTIQGAKRTTGANKGKLPRVIVVRVG